MTLVRNPLPCCWSSRVEKRKLLDPVGALKEKFLRPSPPLFHPQVGVQQTHVPISDLGSYLILAWKSRLTCTFNKNYSKGISDRGIYITASWVQADYSQMLSTIILKPCIMWKYLTPASHAAATWIDRAPSFHCADVIFSRVLYDFFLCLLNGACVPRHFYLIQGTVCYRSPFDNQSHC